MSEAPIVVKIGGGANVGHATLAAEAAQVPGLVLVHGCSAEATSLGEALGVPARFVTSPGGHRSRFTDEPTLDVVHLAAQRVNARLVAACAAHGATCVGLRAGDAGVRAEWKDALRVVTPEGRTVVQRGDRSGRITHVDPRPLRALLDAGLLPVVGPIARTPSGQLASVDGDRAAAALAQALGARALVILTGVPGVLHDPTDPASRIPTLRLKETDESAPFILGAMKRKVLAAKEAVAAGVPRVAIGPAAAAAPVRNALEGGGTLVVA